MCWKQNTFSYLMWLIYSCFSGAFLLMVTEPLGDSLLGGIPCGGLYLWLGIFLVVCAGVLGLHRRALKQKPAGRGDEASGSLGAATVAMVLLFLGLVLRALKISGNGEMAAYFESAKVVEGQDIPQVVHGISYLYLQLLRIVFLFLGNKFIIAVWTQVILQLAAALLLYVAVKKLSGSLAALLMLGFLMKSDYTVQGALTLSPQMLFLLIFALGLVFLSGCQKGKVKPAPYLWVGIWCGLASYLDIGGLLLAALLFVTALGEREEKPAAKEKCFAVVSGLMGMSMGLFGAFALDAFLSHRPFTGIMRAWWELYRPQEFNFSMAWEASQSGWLGLLLAVLLMTGIFSFWHDRSHDRRGGWILAACAAGAGSCFGMFTEEAPAALYLLLFLTILAGIGMRDIVRCPGVAPEAVKKEGEESGMMVSTAVQADPEKSNIEKNAFEESVSEKAAPENKAAPRYIENPLPLPKPHVKKVMGYALELTEEQYDFDYSVSDNDDFDI